MEYYSAIKSNKVLIHSTTWMHIENIMPSERSQTQKNTHCRFLLYEIPIISKSIETESKLVVVSDEKEEGMGCNAL